MSEQLNSDQQKRLKEMLQKPDMLGQAFDLFSQNQTQFYKAKLVPWTVLAICWTLFFFVVSVGTLLSYFVPGYSQFTYPLLILSGISVLVRALILFAIPRPQ